MIKKLFSNQLIRFAIVGVLNTLFGSCLMFALYNFFNVSYWVSSSCNYIFGSILSFFLNKYFTFKNRERGGKQIIKFIFLIVLCYFTAYSIAKPIAFTLLEGYSIKIQENVAMAVGMCLFTALNFCGQKFVVFNKK